MGGMILNVNRMKKRVRWFAKKGMAVKRFGNVIGNGEGKV